MTYPPATWVPATPAARSRATTRSGPGGSRAGADPSVSRVRSRASRVEGPLDDDPVAAARPYSPAISSACAAVISPRRISSRGSPIPASTRSARGRPARFLAARRGPGRRAPGSRGPAPGPAGARSPPAVAATASTSASAVPGSPAPRSSRGRSAGSTQTSGSIPAWRARASRSCATAPSDRSSTVTWPPAASRRPPSMAVSADQPASVPPATSTRSIPVGRVTPYHCRCAWKARPRASHSRNRRACSSCRRPAGFPGPRGPGPHAVPRRPPACGAPGRRA